MAVTQKNKNILYARSNNCCTIPTCRKILVRDGVKDRDSAFLNAEVAHIRGEKPGSARYDPNMSDEERNSYDNLILVCPNCHNIIDHQPNIYTVDLLKKYKQEHEKRVMESIKREVTNVTFSELDIVIKYLLANKLCTEGSLTLIPPDEKIKKNNLSTEIKEQIVLGMTKVKQVENYIQKMTGTDSSFVNRLINGFVLEYNRLQKEENKSGDELFKSLLDFTWMNLNKFEEKAAGLSVLVYLFEKCEVFEK